MISLVVLLPPRWHDSLGKKQVCLRRKWLRRCGRVRLALARSRRPSASARSCRNGSAAWQEDYERIRPRMRERGAATVTAALRLRLVSCPDMADPVVPTSTVFFFFSRYYERPYAELSSMRSWRPKMRWVVSMRSGSQLLWKVLPMPSRLLQSLRRLSVSCLLRTRISAMIVFHLDVSYSMHIRVWRVLRLSFWKETNSFGRTHKNDTLLIFVLAALYYLKEVFVA